MAVLLTDPYVKTLKPGEVRLEVADTLVTGLRLRVSPKGVKSWFVWYRTKAGKAARHRLGTYPKLKLRKARDAAKDRLAEVQLGGDPQADLRASRVQAERDEKTTIKALVTACIEALPLRLTTSREWGRLAKAEIIPPFGTRQAQDLRRAEIREWCESIRDGKRRWRREGRAAPYTANRAFELLRRTFSWGLERDLLEASPFVGLKLPSAEEQSERVLTREELRALLLALGSCPREIDVYKAMWSTYADAVHLLLLTLVRRAAVLGLRRDELEDLGDPDFAGSSDAARWIVPGGAEGRSKSGRAHVVPLSPSALAVVRRRLDAAPGEHLFPVGRRKAGEDRPATWPSGFVEDLRTETERQYRLIVEDDAATVPPWRIHDLRHAGATHLREDLGVSSEVVSLLLGHTPPGPRVSRVYNRAELLPERRAALVAWAAWLDRIASEKPKRADVVPMARGRR